MTAYGTFALRMSEHLSLEPAILGGMIVLTADDALRLPDAGEESGIHVAGVDAFEPSEVSNGTFVQPSMGHGIDFSYEDEVRGTVDALHSCAAARALIESRRHPGLHFEVVFDE
ncbi:MAG: hypothetical protein AVDCRST_MAG08-271 [uncultured Acetobacteraceae bacterium]|uniref:Uncharacterized protein n=1 Tax=uncultured Acetobacteraceae bacterium TaxID=169975 RepID=A0A6J4H708_9PROT|nr:MAG: hypothetical protein AVDCRST_MAG08-271 [uncultured Acetobacteraceae bacterium]